MLIGSPESRVQGPGSRVQSRVQSRFYTMPTNAAIELFGYIKNIHNFCKNPLVNAMHKMIIWRNENL